MMIYLNGTALERVLETAHFALEHGGFLFLGASESVSSAADLFVPVSRDLHIFQTRSVSSRPLIVPQRTPQFPHLKTQKVALRRKKDNTAADKLSFRIVHQQLLDLYAPPSLIINEQHDVLHVTERASRYLQIMGGELSRNLLKLVRPELRMELQTALFSAEEGKANVEARSIKVKIDDTVETVNIIVRPVLGINEAARGPKCLQAFETLPISFHS